MMTSTLREIASLWRFFRMPESDKRLIFYSESESYFAYFEGLVAALKETTDVPIVYVTSDPDDPILDGSDDRVRGLFIRTLLPFFMKFVRCRVFVMTLTDLNQFHLQRSVNDVHYVYVFHAMNSIHMCYRYGAFDYYDSIFCTGPYQVEELETEARLRSISSRHLVAAGYSRVERINSAWTSRGAERLGKEPTVLLAPSWAASNVLEKHGEALIQQLLERGYSVIARPHPETVKRYPELLTRIHDSFSPNPRFCLEKSVRTDDSLLEADVLITDWSGIALEYAFGTERPVIYIDVPRKVHNDKYESLGIEPFEVRMREQLGVIVQPEHLDNIDEVVADLIDRCGEFRARILELRQQNIFNFGSASQVGAKYIAGLLSAGHDE